MLLPKRVCKFSAGYVEAVDPARPCEETQLTLWPLRLKALEAGWITNKQIEAALSP